VEHVDKLVLILGLHDGRIGHTPQVGHVEKTVVRGAVVRREAGAVHAEHDGQILEANVVDDGIKAALQKSGVDGDHGL